jgi:hypothetical protein
MQFRSIPSLWKPNVEFCMQGVVAKCKINISLDGTVILLEVIFRVDIKKHSGFLTAVPANIICFQAVSSNYSLTS